MHKIQILHVFLGVVLGRTGMVPEHKRAGGLQDGCHERIFKVCSKTAAARSGRLQRIKLGTARAGRSFHS